MTTRGLFNRFDDVWLLDGVRTPMVDYCGAFASVNPIDMGIKVAREILTRTSLPAERVETVIAGNMAPGGFDQFYVPRHIALYADVPREVPSQMAQRICGTGFELFRQASEQITLGIAELALLVGTESMIRHPIAAFDHRTGFTLDAGVAFKDYMWESLADPAVGISMIQTAENLAKKYGITREDVDAFASRSFERAVEAQESDWLGGEIVAVGNERFELEGYKARTIKLTGKASVADRDTHPRLSPPEVLAKLRSVYPDGVRTGGNSSALIDAAAAALVASESVARDWGRRPLARVAAAAVVGVPPEIMGIGPAPAIRLLLERTGIRLDDIARFEINEAQSALDRDELRRCSPDTKRLRAPNSLRRSRATYPVRMRSGPGARQRRSGLGANRVKPAIPALASRKECDHRQGSHLRATVGRRHAGQHRPSLPRPMDDRVGSARASEQPVRSSPTNSRFASGQSR